MESFKIELISNASVKLFRTKHSDPLKTFCRTNSRWKINGRLQFWKNLTHQCNRMSQRESLCFSKENLQSPLSFTIWNPVSALPLRILFMARTLSFKRDTTTAKTVSQLNYLEECKKLRFTLQMKYLVLYCLVRTSDTFSVAMLAMNLE